MKNAKIPHSKVIKKERNYKFPSPLSTKTKHPRLLRHILKTLPDSRKEACDLLQEFLRAVKPVGADYEIIWDILVRTGSPEAMALYYVGNLEEHLRLLNGADLELPRLRDDVVEQAKS
jgi:hypothetical protein